MPAHRDLSLAGLRLRWGGPDDGRAWMALTGDLDGLSLPVLAQTLDSLWAAGTTRLEIDLSGLAFVDSGGLGALVGAWRHATEAGGTLTATNPTEPVRQLMKLTGIDRFLLEGP